MKEGEAEPTAPSPGEMKRRLRALLQQEQHCTRRAFLQQQLCQMQRNKKPNTSHDLRDLRLLHMMSVIPKASKLRRRDQKTLLMQASARHAPASRSCNRSPPASTRRATPLRMPKRELTEAEQRPALRGSAGGDAAGLLNEEEPTHISPSAVLSSSSPSHAGHDGNTCARSSNIAVVKPECVGPAASSLPECITISDSSDENSRCSSPPPPVVRQQTDKQETSVGGISGLRSGGPAGVSRYQPLPTNAATDFCSGGDNNGETQCDNFNNASQERDEAGVDASQEGDEAGLAESRIGPGVAPASSTPAACSNTERLQHLCSPRGATQDGASRARRGSDEDTTAHKPQERFPALDVSEGALQQQDQQQQMSQTGEALADPATDATGSNSTHRPSVTSGWPECVVDMLGPDVFNLLKEEPHLVHARSEHSGMSMFHHLLRRPSKDDEQVLELFKCIYEDEPLKERVALPPFSALKCDRGQTLAFYAAAYGHPKCLKWILEQIGGESSQRQFLDIRDTEGDTPLHYAVKNGHVSVVELLLNVNPDMLNRQRNDGQTPLFDAIERPAIVRLLLRHGADYRVRCNMGLTPLEMATDELRWKRLCASRGCKILPKRLSFSVHLLKKAERDGWTGGSGGESVEDQNNSSCSTSGSTARAPDVANPVENCSADTVVGEQGSQQEEDIRSIDSHLEPQEQRQSQHEQQQQQHEQQQQQHEQQQQQHGQQLQQHEQQLQQREQQLQQREQQLQQHEQHLQRTIQ
ncbi:Pfs, NB-ARC and Ankyrin domain protein, related [Eimeria mitis]|uniref:Pfs, NB-ARC and Ankyrin domain protein, related n=1 Tax=Eimeria mitis TaxID=44415 RepID=U6K4N2_9EIME|nr:Pfs, NB-ARC and Ankyrin domain protein, related [Eimeria mitis]CDJ31292.1 Pfs, NB-ARC and Ankyrin domain protein, related [Eimeria mitis]